MPDSDRGSLFYNTELSYLVYHNILYICVQFQNYNMNRIKEVLDEKGIKQTWLAEKLGKSFCIVNAYACNRRQPSLEQLFEIANILQVDPKDLIANK